ncbi:MAG: nicotinamide mononucleotide transporter [Pseudopedobacter saltans]|uniref:Nicotinamide riboside transporter PnuC n=1 Tax=Pseudopedobacter saltans TaxID=151895 RepID=A0A2W5FA31_9SPHI|nr:MAG: nicotinamide mononucleotide transporter [Pseudopedobacter saltans]
MQNVYQQFLAGLKETSIQEYIAVFLGIASTFLSKMENIWVYPTGIVSTAIYILISFEGELYAEAGLNIYYTLMSIYGWWLWSNKDNIKDKFVITRNNGKDWVQTSLFFLLMFTVLFFILKKYTPSTVPIEDAVASASAYTAMFLMNKKKVESWYWWILTDLISMPLYFMKGYVFTSVQFLVFLVIAITGLFAWLKKSQQNNQLA